jgi:hypothetical protein
MGFLGSTSCRGDGRSNWKREAVEGGFDCKVKRGNEGILDRDTTEVLSRLAQRTSHVMIPILG